MAEKDRSSLQLMLDNARRLLNLVNQLLDISKLETGEIKLQIKEGNLTAFVKRIVLTFISLAESRNINGSNGVYHRGCSFVGATSINEPRLDWCMQESTTPRIINIHMILSRTASPV